MSVTDPSWKKKTRPCPFYSQGRCLFADSCNFLHDAKIKAALSDLRTTTSGIDAAISVYASPIDSALVATPLPSSSPHVRIQFPQLLRSPPRSPRMSSLLSALEDVIGPDVVDCSQIPPSPSSQSSGIEDASDTVNAVQPDSDEEETVTVSSAAVASDHRRTPSVDTTATGLLSPVDISYGPPIPFPHNESGGSIPREDSIDSGYAESWVGPTPFALSPPHAYRPTSTFDLLSSPFGSPSTRVLSPKANALSPRFHPSTPLTSPSKAKFSVAASNPDATEDADESGDVSFAESLDSPRERLSFPMPPSSFPVPQASSVHKNSISGHSSSASHDAWIPSFAAGTSLAQVMRDSIASRRDSGKAPISPAVDLDVLPVAAVIPARDRPISELTQHSKGLVVGPESGSDATAATSPADPSDILTTPALAMMPGRPISELTTLAETVSLPELPHPAHSPLADDSDTLTATMLSTVRGRPISELTVLTERVSLPRLPQLATSQPALLSPDATSPADDSDTLTAATSVTLRSRPISELPVLAEPVSLPELHQPSPSQPTFPQPTLPQHAFPLPELPQPEGSEMESKTQHTDVFEDSEELVSSSSPTGAGDEHAYDGLYESLILSPQEAASKRMSWASRAGSLALHPSFLSLDILDRPRSALEVRSRPLIGEASHASPVLSDHTFSRTSSALVEQPMSAGPSTRMSFASRDRVFRRPTSIRSAADSKTFSSAAPSPISEHAEGPLPLSAPIAISAKGKGKATEETSRGRLEHAPARNKWDNVETSKKVPFGFRSSFTGSTIRTKRSRPSISTDVASLSDRILTPDSARFSSADQAQPSPVWMKPFRLSRALESSSLPPSSRRSSFVPSLNHVPQTSIASSSNSNDPSSSDHALLSSPHSAIPDNRRHTQFAASNISLLLSSPDYSHHPFVQGPPQSAPISHSQSWHNRISQLSNSQDRYPRSSSRLSEPVRGAADNDGDSDVDEFDSTIRVPVVPHTAPASRASSSLRSHMSSTPEAKPTLMFAIASDDVEEVRRVLEGGEVNPNDAVGPQSALAFALTNERLAHKMDIVKTLLAYGADPGALSNPELNPPNRSSISTRASMVLSPPPTTTLETMDPATRYYVQRADATHTRKTSALIQKSFYRPLTRVRYDIAGQDRVFEQLFMVLNRHSRRFAVAPLVVLLCGPSGHGKSLLARKFGSLLDVPTHTVNVTTLRSTHDLWESYSMSPYEEPTSLTLAQFLLENEGKRCVVVLDEIEKTEDPKVLYSLLMPWELGRCSPPGGGRHIDVRNVVWLGTSNVGHDLVFEYQEALAGPGMTREQYVELSALLRPKVSDRLGASLLSRVTSVLPFVPFSEDEKMAIATEALYSLGGELAKGLPLDVVETTACKALAQYLPAEGARSLHRAISGLLLDISELEE